MKPNILFINVDHWSGRLIGALGHPTILTPTLNELIGNGIAYTNAYCTTPSCIPARREIMTGTFSPTHGDRVFNERLPMPDLPTMPQIFSQAGYQTFSVGKLHVYPQRDRIGFDDALLNEEGRHHLGITKDDYEMFLAENGFAGQEYAHGQGNNDYTTRAWHLPEYYHHTNWTVREMSKYIARRNPEKPSLWHMSFTAPHPPLVPLTEYLDLYRDIEIDMPYTGEWALNQNQLPFALENRRLNSKSYSDKEIELARKAFYAMCTHVDHQIRLIIGLLREENILDNTILLFTSDHGDMLGNHGQFMKDIFYEDSSKIPLILVPQSNIDLTIGHNDKRLATQADILPTLLDLCEIKPPKTIEGESLIGESKRKIIYGEHWEGAMASRMIRNSQYKLIYYPAGNVRQLFDINNDPNEMKDLSQDNKHKEILNELTKELTSRLYGNDLEWIDEDSLQGIKINDDLTTDGFANIPTGNKRGLGGQRGLRLN